MKKTRFKCRQLLWIPAVYRALCVSLYRVDATDIPWKNHELLKLLLGVGEGGSYG